MRRTLLSLSVVALVAAGCGGTDGSEGGSGADAKQTLIDGIKQLEASEGLTATFTVQSTPESVQALAANGGDELGSDDASLILGSSMTVSGVEGDSPEDGVSEVIFDLGGVDALDLRVIGRDFYLRSDVRGVVETLGEDSAQIDQAAAQFATQPGFEFVEPALNGEWLALEGGSELSKSFTGSDTTTLSQQQVLEGFVRSVSQSADVTQEGADDAGTHLVATLPLRDLYEDYSALLEQVPMGAAGGSDLPEAGDLPEGGELIVDAWVRDGALSQIELDLLQFADEADQPIPAGVDELALRFTIAAFDGAIDPPEGAVTVDLMQVLGAFGGGF